MTLIKGFEEEPDNKEPSADGLLWKNKRLKDISSREKNDIIFQLFKMNWVLQQKIKEQEQKNRIIQTPYS